MKVVWEKVQYKFDTSKSKWMEEDDEVESFEEEYEEDPLAGHLGIPIGNIISTPFGMFEVDEAFNPLNHFEFWIGHTDFDLTQNFVNVVEKIPGVEGLKVFSRYRFLLAIGKLFEFTKVRPVIELSVGSLQISKEILDLREQFSKEEKDWYIYVYPDLKNYISCFVTDEDFEAKYNKMTDLSQNGGILLSSLTS